MTSVLKALDLVDLRPAYRDSLHINNVLNLKTIYQAAQNHEEVRVDSSGHFYSLYKADGVLAPLIHLVNLVLKVINEWSFSVFYSQQSRIQEKLSSILDEQHDLFSTSLVSIPEWALEINEKKQSSQIAGQKTQAEKDYKQALAQSESHYKNERENLLNKKQQTFGEMRVLVQKFNELKKNHRESLRKLNQLLEHNRSHKKDAGQLKEWLSWIGSELQNWTNSWQSVEPHTKRIGEDSVSKLENHILKLKTDLKIKHRETKKRLDVLESEIKQFQKEIEDAKARFLKTTQKQNDDFQKTMIQLGVNERKIAHESYQRFKKSHIHPIQEKLAVIKKIIHPLYFHLSLDLTLEQRAELENKLHEYQRKFDYLQLMAENIRSKSAIIDVPQVDIPAKENPEEEIQEIKNLLRQIARDGCVSEQTLRSSFNYIPIEDFSKRAQKDGYKITYIAKKFIERLNQIQHSYPDLKRKIISLRLFVLNHIATMPRVKLSFDDIGLAIP